MKRVKMERSEKLQLIVVMLVAVLGSAMAFKNYVIPGITEIYLMTKNSATSGFNANWNLVGIPVTAFVLILGNISLMRYIFIDKKRCEFNELQSLPVVILGLIVVFLGIFLLLRFITILSWSNFIPVLLSFYILGISVLLGFYSFLLIFLFIIDIFRSDITK